MNKRFEIENGIIACIVTDGTTNRRYVGYASEADGEPVAEARAMLEAYADRLRLLKI